MIGPNSGFTPSTVRNILKNEYLRRILNCSVELPDEVKNFHLSRLNLDAKNAGHTAEFRRSLTITANKMFKNKLSSDNLFQNKAEVQLASRNKPDKSNWFRGSGEVDAMFNVPPTPNQELLIQIRKTLAGVASVPGTRIRPQQSYGQTILQQVMTRDIGNMTTCDRNNCLVCCHPDTKGGCRKQSVTYQISCDRSPCSDGYDKSNPLAQLSTRDNPPALYRGETSKDCYIRGSQHNRDYKNKLDGSSLWRHADDVHDGIIGPNDGIKDYRMTQLRSYPRPLDRVAAEGVLIGDLDDQDQQGAAVSLNSKRDWMQANTVTLQFNKGARKN